MFKSKKVVLAATVLAFVASSSFAEGITFWNKLASDVVAVTTTDDGTETAFAGIVNTTKAAYSSEKLDFALKISFWGINGTEVYEGKDWNYFSFGAFNGTSPFSAGYKINDYSIEFRPVEVLGIGFHKAYAVAGSYLPVEDDDNGNGNIGSDLGVFIRPIEGLTIGAGLDFVSVFGGYKDSVNHADPKLNFGAEYWIKDTVGFGLAFRNVINDFAFGAYASFVAVEDLTINAGFTYNGDFCGITGNFASVGVMFGKDALAINADLIVDVDNADDDGLDLYTGIDISFQVSDPLTIGIAGTFSTDFDYNKDKNIGTASIVSANPYLTFAVNNHHTLGASVKVEIELDNSTVVTFPIYWKYAL